jgi:hypothetical protein
LFLGQCHAMSWTRGNALRQALCVTPTLPGGRHGEKTHGLGSRERESGKQAD